MDFGERVRSLRNQVLSKPEYRVAIESVINRANKYKAEVRLDQKLNEETSKDDEEMII